MKLHLSRNLKIVLVWIGFVIVTFFAIGPYLNICLDEERIVATVLGIISYIIVIYGAIRLNLYIQKYGDA